VSSLGWRKDAARWDGERLLAVVNKTHGQTFEALASRYRLDEVTEVGAARLVWDSESAAVFEVPRALGDLWRRPEDGGEVGPRAAAGRTRVGGAPGPDDLSPRFQAP
jgi:hypothetical protein